MDRGEKILTTLVDLWCDQYGYSVEKLEISDEKSIANVSCSAVVGRA